MSISTAINGAFSGLRATQAAMDVVASNVANSGTPGYTRRVLGTTQLLSGENTTGVDVVGAQRVLDALVQKQLRLETAGAAYTGVKAAYHTRLDAMFDAPGAAGSLPTLAGAFSSSLSALANNPTSYAAQSGVVSAATDLASSLNDLSSQIQSLRQEAEDSLGQAVGNANNLLRQIAGLSSKMSADPDSAASAGLQDQRDGLVDQLSQLMDVRVTARATGGISISTTGGLQLFDGSNATMLSFDARATIGPTSAYDRDPTKRSVGTITATDPSGRSIDAIGSGLIRSGQIAACVELRDDTLPQAQRQLDALAAGLASSLSDTTVAGNAATSGAANGFDLDLSSLQNGNTFTIGVTSGGAPKTVIFAEAGSAAAAAAATSSGSGVVGIDFSGGLASVVSQIQAKLGSGFAVSNPSGSTLRVLDDGAAATTDVGGLSAAATTIGLASGNPQLPLFTDGSSIYSGSFERGSQLTGLAARIAVNAGIRTDPGSLVVYSGSTPASDTMRPQFLHDAVTSRTVSFAPGTGIGGPSGSYFGTILDFGTQIVATQAAAANSAKSFDDGQKVVLNAVQSRFSDLSGVNIDTELTQLIQLQTAYGANARVMSAAKDMLDTLMAVGR